MEYNNNNNAAQRIQDRLKSAKADGPYVEVTTQPTRTVTCIYPSGFQSQHGDKVKGENNG